MNPTAEALKRELGAVVIDDPLLLAEAARCTSGFSRKILAVVEPTTVEEVVGVVRAAARVGVPIYPVSTGRNWGYGSASPVVDGCVLVKLARMNRVLEFDADLGIVTLEPGVTQGDLAGYLETHGGAYLVPTTGAGPSASIVGNALDRGYGITPFADHFGAVMSLEAVLPDGSLYRSPLSALGASGLDRAFKWGIGPYLDGLFAQGAFGIVTRMTIALERRPERVKAFLFGLAGDDQLESCVEILRELMARLPGLVGGVNLMNARRVLAMAAPYSQEAVGPDGLISDAALAEQMRKYKILPWTGYGTLYGTRRTVDAARREIRVLLRGTASRLVFLGHGTARTLNRWASRLPAVLGGRVGATLRTLESSLDLINGHPNDTALPLAYWRSGRRPENPPALDPVGDRCGLIWYAPLVEMQPSRVRAYVQFVESTMRRHRHEPLITLTALSPRCFGSTVPILFDGSDSVQTAPAQQCYQALLEGGVERGFVPYRFGIQSMGWLANRNEPYWALVEKLKHAADPAHLISPGRYCPWPPNMA